MYIEDSQAISGIIKLFRKVIQNLTNFNEKHLIMNRINIKPKTFSTEFKVILLFTLFIESFDYRQKRYLSKFHFYGPFQILPLP